MKKEQKTNPVKKAEKKTGPGSNPVNKFKKGKTTTAAAINNIITGAVENVKAQSGKGFTNRGTVTSYEDER